jgi:hypothetical protein
MTITSLKSSQKATATSEVLASLDVRTLIANQLGVDVKRSVDAAEQQEGCEEEICAGGRRQCPGEAAFFTRGPFGPID